MENEEWKINNRKQDCKMKNEKWAMENRNGRKKETLKKNFLTMKKMINDE